MDALRPVLLGHDLTVQDGHRDHIGQAVVRLLLGPDHVLIPLFAAADDVVGDVENLDLDLLDIFRAERLVLLELEDAFQGGLGVDLGVVLLEDGPGYPLQVLFATSRSRTGPAMASIKPLFPSKTSSGPVMPRMARKVAWVQQKAVLG